MIIRTMQATFGCLDGARLDLREGVNSLVLPNESGKSTWTAFLTAMLYGIDTTQRASKGRLPDKLRYAPWSGKPMEGLVELEWKGREIVVQRTSARGRPMGEFRAWEKATGLDVPELTGETCGKTLLGVERAVFVRSALLRGEELAVTQDQDLSRRLGALAASGGGEDSFLAADSRLKQWQNRIRYHQTGLLPEAEDRLAALREKQVDRRALETELSQLDIALRDISRERGNLPPERTLSELLARLDAPEEVQPGPEAPCPPALAGLEAEAVWPKAQADAARYDALTAVARPRPWWVAILLLAGAALVWNPWAALALGVAGAIWAGIWAKKFRRFRKNQAEAQNMLSNYAARDKAALLSAAVARRDWLLARERVCQADWQRAVLLEQLRELTPDPEAALARHRSLTRQEETLTRQRLSAEARLDAMDAPEKEIAALEARIADLRAREQAILSARSALSAANDRLTQVYAPRLTALAGERFAALTGGRYSGLLLDRDLTLSARETSGLVRPLGALSRGTQDQAWLALRLAMTELLLPPDAPVILDDALLTFDEVRTRTALETLNASGRQVLLFSCR